MDVYAEGIVCMKKAKEVVMFLKSLEIQFKAQSMWGMIVTVESGGGVLSFAHWWGGPSTTLENMAGSSLRWDGGYQFGCQKLL